MKLQIVVLERFNWFSEKYNYIMHLFPIKYSFKNRTLNFKSQDMRMFFVYIKSDISFKTVLNIILHTLCFFNTNCNLVIYIKIFSCYVTIVMIVLRRKHKFWLHGEE